MATFKKISELSAENTKKLEKYWAPLWGTEFAKALTKNYKPDGDHKKVDAKTKSIKK
jgi:hypothetical protein